MSEQLSAEVVQEVSKVITVSSVLALLEQGKSREEIAEHFGESVAAMKATVWQHPKLKNRKAKKQFAINLVDDTDSEEVSVVEENNTVTEETVQEVFNPAIDLEDDVQAEQPQVLDNVQDVPVTNGTW